MEGEIRVTLVNAWGVPVKVLNLVDLQVKQELTRLPNNKVAEFEIQQEQDNKIDINSLVKELRQKVKSSIQEHCGTMQVLDMTQPIELNHIYTNVNILEKITGRRRKEIAELLQECNSADFERFGLGKIAEKRVSGLKAVEKYTKLMILGKPGAGKTTFLKYVAMQCIAGNFQAERVPVFVTLYDFAEARNKPGLLEYICQQLSNAGAETQNFASMQEVITHGRTLILLDGLDEVREEDSKRVLNEIRDFSDEYRDSHFVIACRIAAQEYTFDKFTEVELADFDNEQIATFANNWFKDKAIKPEIFLERIQYNRRVTELARDPLWLTLLCLVFEESGDFPANRSELYKEGLDALLKKWDAKRGIERHQIYKKLSVQRKEDLLSKIALTTFVQGDYFFKQRVVEQYIADYLRTLPDVNSDLKALELDSEKVLQSIEAQHGLLVERAKGIYSFHHLAFHEYFTAREIIVGKQSSDEALQNLVSHITKARWREVFLLAVGMLPSADRLLLLMKQQIDMLVASDNRLQQFLEWVSQKSASVEVPFKSVAVRALYFHFELDRAHNTVSARVSRVFKLAYTLDRAFAITPTFDLDHAFYNVLVLARALAPELVDASAFEADGSSDIAPELKQSLQELKGQLPDPYKDKERFNVWRKAQGQAWADRLKAVIIKYHGIGYDWQFDEQQKGLLKEYYDANNLLVDCLNSDCYVSQKVQQEIEDTLLLPLGEFSSSYTQFYEGLEEASEEIKQVIISNFGHLEFIVSADFNMDFDSDNIEEVRVDSVEIIDKLIVSADDWEPENHLVTFELKVNISYTANISYESLESAIFDKEDQLYYNTEFIKEEVHQQVIRLVEVELIFFRDSSYNLCFGEIDYIDFYSKNSKEPILIEPESLENEYH
ncbi:NACHT domain-containing NTPase [Microcoleus sp. FACHB-672]|nr:NACHT domain-containing NTPase [Microcoleus sp. FACHB-672]